MALMSKSELVHEVYACSKWVNNVYAAPEQVNYARRFLSAIEKDFGLTYNEILDDPDLLDPKLEEKHKNFKPKFLGSFLKVSSSHNILDDKYIGGFEDLPVVGKPFVFFMEENNYNRHLTTSTVRKVEQESDSTYVINTNNSVYRVVIQ